MDLGAANTLIRRRAKASWTRMSKKNVQGCSEREITPNRRRQAVAIETRNQPNRSEAHRT